MKKIQYILMLGLLFLMAGCEKDTLPMNFSPALTTGDATDIYRMGATLSGFIQKPEGAVVKDCGILISELQSMAEYTEVKSISTESTFSVSVHDLIPGKTYFYCTYASSGYSIARGQIKSFNTTDSNAPVFDELHVTARDEKSFTVSATILDEGGSSLILCGFCYKEVGDNVEEPTVGDNVVNVEVLQSSLTSYIKDLTPNKEYMIRAYGINTQGVGYGKTVKVLTQNATVPAISSITPLDSTLFSITASASILSNGESEVTEYGFCWSSEVQMPTTAHLKQSADRQSADGIFSLKIENLQSETTYYIRAYAINKQGTGYGDVMKYTISKMPTIGIHRVDVNGLTVKIYAKFDNADSSLAGHCYYLLSRDRNNMGANEGQLLNTLTSGEEGVFGWEVGGLLANSTYYVGVACSDPSVGYLESEIQNVVTGSRGIRSLKDLNDFRAVTTDVNADVSAWQDENGVVNLLADLDLSENDLDWSILVIKEGLIFDGNGHTIKYYKNKLGSLGRWGLFYTNNGTIRNLNVQSKFRLSIQDTDKTVRRIGGICYENNGTILSCKSMMDAESETDIGGIATLNRGVIELCKTEGNMQSGGAGAGIVTINEGSVLNCHNKAVISQLGTNADCLGGIVGYNQIGSVINGCVNDGTVRIKNACSVYGVAGIAARHFGGDIILCTNNGTIVGLNLARAVGGVSGDASSSYFPDVPESQVSRRISSCINNGEVSGSVNTTGNTCGTLGGKSILEYNTYGGMVNGVAGTPANAIGKDNRAAGVNKPGIDDLPNHEWK